MTQIILYNKAEDSDNKRMDHAYIVVKFSFPEQPNLRGLKLICPICRARLYFPFFATLDDMIHISGKFFAIKLIKDPICLKDHTIPLNEYIEWVKEYQERTDRPYRQKIRVYDTDNPESSEKILASFGLKNSLISK